ncbi:MAG TPA: hypothetical protein VGX02_03975 [Candidatus Eremiobacteraceae bacterium]|nr:hypothetical protein [Candidatus Eremiobacteraceae bacterium]
MRSSISALSARFVIALGLFALVSAAAGPAGTVCGACQAGDLSNGTISVAAAADANFTLTGVVQGVSYDQNVIEVLAAGVKQSIHITPTTSIAKHGEAGSIADLRPGVHVAVTGIVQGGQHVAVTIEIK